MNPSFAILNALKAKAVIFVPAAQENQATRADDHTLVSYCGFCYRKMMQHRVGGGKKKKSRAVSVEFYFYPTTSVRCRSSGGRKPETRGSPSLPSARSRVGGIYLLEPTSS